MSQGIVQFGKVAVDAFVLDRFRRKKGERLGPVISGSGKIAAVFGDLRFSGEILQVSGVDEMAAVGAEQGSDCERRTAIGAEGC